MNRARNWWPDYWIFYGYEHIHAAELSKSDVGSKVTLCGWVDTIRDHGGVIFIDLRDRYGLTQVIFDPNDSQESWNVAQSTRSEYVILAQGVVEERPANMANDRLTTGQIEIRCDTIEVLNSSKTPPFSIDDSADRVNEDLKPDLSLSRS